MPEPTQRKIDFSRDSVSDKNFDSSQSAKVLDSAGRVVREPGKARKALVEELLTRLQNTVDNELGGIGFVSKVDLVANHLHSTVMYTDSLKEAAEAIIRAYPSNNLDAPLQELTELCDVVVEGVHRVQPYIDVIKSFSEDLDRIKAEVYTQIQTLFQEI